jgi:hypothetical protein
LRVRTEYVGKHIKCKYCRDVFQPEAPAAPVLTTAAAAPDGAGERIAELEAELAQVRTQLAARAADPARYVELPCRNCQRLLRVRTEYVGRRIACKYCRNVFRPEAEDGQLLPLAVRLAAPPRPGAAGQRLAQLEADLQQVRGELAARSADHAAAVQDAERARAEAARLAEEVQAVHGGASAAADLRTELAAASREAEHLRTQVAELEARADQAPALADELHQARERAAQLEAELTASTAAGQRLTEQLAAVEAQAQARDAIAADEHRQRIRELEQAHAEATTAHQLLTRDHEEALSRWDRERQELLGQWEEQQRLHAKEGEVRLGAEQARALAERHELETAQQQTVQRLRGELDRLGEALAQSRREEALTTLNRAALADQVRALQAERAALQAELRQARGQLATHAADLLARAQDMDRAREEAARLAEQMQALHITADQAETRQRQQAEGLRTELATTGREAEFLRAQVAELEARADQAATLAGELDEAQQRAAQLEAELARSRAEAERLTDELAAAESWAHQASAARADTDEPVEVDESMLEPPLDLDEILARKAMDALWAEEGWSWLGLPAEAQPSAEVQAQLSLQQLSAARQEFTRERAALQNEAARLRQDNTKLRQLLERCGIQLG